MRAPATRLAFPALLLASALAWGCVSSTERVRIACVPEQVKVYVDGRLLEAGESEVDLRTDAPHKIYVKGPGYEPQLVVLEPSLDADGKATLGSDAVCVEVVPIGMERELELHMERDAPVEVPAR
jgi:hypothetical protein